MRARVSIVAGTACAFVFVSRALRLTFANASSQLRCRGFDSVHAVGTVTPGKWGSMDIGGKDVQVPEGKPAETNVQSSFRHDEYLVYDEAQVRIRYVLTVKL